MEKMKMYKICIITCEKCGHKRAPRVAKPLKCPMCGHIPGQKIRIKKQKTTPFCLEAPGAVDNPLSEKGGSP
jgi:hypothetical protein